MSMVNNNHVSHEHFSPCLANNSPVQHKKPVRLKNYTSKAEGFDSLHIKRCELVLKMTGETLEVDHNPRHGFNETIKTRSGIKKSSCSLKNYQDADKSSWDVLHNNQYKNSTPCTNQLCLGSLMAHTTRTDARSTEEVLKQAKEFLDQYFASIRRSQSPAHIARWEEVQKEIVSSGTYQLTTTELVYGAKLAWRNSVRCIGRIQWSKLQVFDCRSVTTTSGMFEALCNHIKYSTNKGNIRSAITIFPQRTDGNHDFRVWNSQLIGYAGYRQPDGSVIGDPIQVEFTELCQKLGWKGAGTHWDILPLVLSANGHDPDYFDIPQEYILEVHLTHPTFEWFKDLNLRWYALPAVANMIFDCGGIQFTAAPFNGWYMSTEIGCRDLCDTFRYNKLETIALKMGLDIRTPITLWKDKAMVECNVAVLHSFQEKGVTIVDHHTASESFMKHMDNETRLRQGCPADWVWIVPPLSGSATPVFHQEMALYYLKPSYEYQEPAWKTHVWKKKCETSDNYNKPRRKFHFKQIARAVKFTSKLFGRALSRRIKATVLYATETGKSEGYAKKLGEIFGHAFNAQVYRMSDYDISMIEHEALLLVVTSTFGNGDPPENGEEFAKNLYTLKMSENGVSNGDPSKLSMASSKSFIKANSQSEIATTKKLDRLDSLRGSVSEPLLEDTFGPLSNVRFAVFGLGSSAYPNFCAFAKYVDNLLGELGGERLLKLGTGDEMCGQEQDFKKWAPQIFKTACETFCLDDDESFLDANEALDSQSLSVSTVRMIDSKAESPLIGLEKSHHRKILSTKFVRRTILNGQKAGKSTVKLEFYTELTYTPGDHVGIFPMNRPELVDKIIERLKGVPDPDKPMELQILTENHTSNGVVKAWEPHDRLPKCSLREQLTRYIDITTPPTPNLLSHFASIATNEEEAKKLNHLATDSAAYEDWRHWRFPHLLEVLEEFPSVTPFAPLLLAQLSRLQPRFYSISSSPDMNPNQLHLTVAVVSYQTEDGKGPMHYGVCSNYLQDIRENETVYLFGRGAPGFQLPTDLTKPIICVGPGTGIAPFRSFWQQRYNLIKEKHQKLGSMWLFFGCRTKDWDLYATEKDEMQKERVIDKVFLALSREPNVPKTYVQNLVMQEAADIYRILVHEKGHYYVCGDVTMAEDNLKTLKDIIKKYGNMNEQQVQAYMLSLRDENRYHEDIFGITLRTREVHNRSRETARIRMASQP